MFSVRSDHRGNLDAGFWVLQKLEAFRYAGRLAQLQLDVGARKYVLILPAVKFQRTASESDGHSHPRWRCGNEIGQSERNDAEATEGENQALEQLPATESEHADTAHVEWRPYR